MGGGCPCCPPYPAGTAWLWSCPTQALRPQGLHQPQGGDEVGPPLTGVSFAGLGNTSGQTPAWQTGGAPGHPPYGQRSGPSLGDPVGEEQLGRWSCPVMPHFAFWTPTCLPGALPIARITIPPLALLGHAPGLPSPYLGSDLPNASTQSGLAETHPAPVLATPGSLPLLTHLCHPMPELARSWDDSKIHIQHHRQTGDSDPLITWPPGVSPLSCGPPPGQQL